MGYRRCASSLRFCQFCFEQLLAPTSKGVPDGRLKRTGRGCTPTVERLARRMFPGQVATKLVSPEPYERDTFTLEGHELRIIEQGRTDSPDSTSLYVPSIGLVVAGDVVYNQCRMFVGDTTPESRKNWMAALDRLAALNPAMVVAGHKKPGAPDSPSAIEDTKHYLLDFDRLQKIATSD